MFADYTDFTVSKLPIIHLTSCPNSEQKKITKNQTLLSHDLRESIILPQNSKLICVIIKQNTIFFAINFVGQPLEVLTRETFFKPFRSFLLRKLFDFDFFLT